MEFNDMSEEAKELAKSMIKHCLGEPAFISKVPVSRKKALLELSEMTGEGADQTMAQEEREVWTCTTSRHELFWAKDGSWVEPYQASVIKTYTVGTLDSLSVPVNGYEAIKLVMGVGFATEGKGVFILTSPDEVSYFDTMNKDLVFEGFKLQSLPSDLCFYGSVSIYEQSFKHLPKNTTFRKSLDISSSGVTQVEHDLTVGGDFDAQGVLEKIADDVMLIVGGDLVLEDCDKLVSLPNGFRVGGDLYLEGSGIASADMLPNDYTVDGNIYYKAPSFSFEM